MTVSLAAGEDTGTWMTPFQNWKQHWTFLIAFGMIFGGILAMSFEIFVDKKKGKFAECGRCICYLPCTRKKVIFSPVAFATGLWIIPAGGLMAGIIEKVPAFQEGKNTITLLYVLLCLGPVLVVGFFGCKIFGRNKKSGKNLHDRDSASSVFFCIVAHCVPDALAMSTFCKGDNVGQTIATAVGYTIEMGILNFDEVLNAVGFAGSMYNPWVLLTVIVPGLIMGVGPIGMVSGLQLVETAYGEKTKEIVEFVLECVAAIVWFGTWYFNATKWIDRQIVNSASSSRATVLELTTGVRPGSPSSMPPTCDLLKNGVLNGDVEAGGDVDSFEDHGDNDAARGETVGAATTIKAWKVANATFVSWVFLGLSVTLILQLIKPTLDIYIQNQHAGKHFYAAA